MYNLSSPDPDPMAWGLWAHMGSRGKPLFWPARGGGVGVRQGLGGRVGVSMATGVGAGSSNKLLP